MSHSCDDTYAVYDETVRRARKRHVCCACHRSINAGDRYADVRTISSDGDVNAYKRCGACQTTHLHLRKLCHTQADPYDMLWPDEELSCGLSYESEWGGDPPAEVACLPLLTDAEAGALL